MLIYKLYSVLILESISNTSQLMKHLASEHNDEQQLEWWYIEIYISIENWETVIEIKWTCFLSMAQFYQGQILYIKKQIILAPFSKWSLIYKIKLYFILTAKIICDD